MTGNNKVLISGSTGFIGSNIARNLLHDGFEVFATRRLSSSLEKCRDLEKKIHWINLEDKNWTISVRKIHPSILIHTAWNGLHEKERNIWELQSSNFEFSKLLFDIAIDSGVNKIIALGSQAEYGISSITSTEAMVPSPVEAYGAMKLLTCNYLKISCQTKLIPWYWLRVFSVFGPGENNEWLIPQVIMKLLNNQEILLTEGKQRYDYLYIDDFSASIKKIIHNVDDFPGIYNICSGKPIEIKELLITLAGLLDVTPNLLKFGAVPYRDNQNMFIAGNCQNFEAKFGKIKSQSLLRSLDKTVKYYKNLIRN